MAVEFIGELHCPIDDFYKLRIEVDSSKASSSEYTLYAYSYGSNRIFLYDLFAVKNEAFSPYRSSSNEAADVECIEDQIQNTRKEYGIRFRNSLDLPFPVYFVVNLTGKIWAIGHDDMLDLKKYIPDEIQKISPNLVNEMFTSWDSQTDNLMDIDLPIPQQCPKYLQSIEIPQRNSTYTAKRSPLCSVSKCSNDGFLLCREDSLNNSWSLQALLPEKNSVELASVPYRKCSFWQHCSKFDLCQTDMHFEDYKPVLTFVQTDAWGDLGKENTLTRSSFVSFFGIETLSFTNSVILFGVPNGQILWHSFLHTPQLEKNLHEFQLLCDLEQPVRGIHIYAQNIESKGDKGNGLIILGALGKVMLLSSGALDHYDYIVQQKNSLFSVLVCYLPPPLYSYTLINDSLLHTCADGQMWISKLLKYEEQPFCSNKMDTHSELTKISEIMLIFSLEMNKELTVCLTFDGRLYLGNFTQYKVVYREIAGQVPALLDKISELTVPIQILQSNKIKQAQVFKAIATFASLQLQVDHLNRGTCCSVAELDAQPKKLQLAISIQDFQPLNFDLGFWNLTANASLGFHQKSLSITKTKPLNLGRLCLHLEIEESFLQFASSSFPLLVEVGLILKVPKLFRDMDCLGVLIQNFPLYLRIRTIVVHELYLCQRADIALIGDMIKHVSSSVWEIYEMKPMSNFDAFEVKEKVYKFSSTYSFRLSISTAQSLSSENLAGADLCFGVLKHLIGNANICETSSDQCLMCFNQPVSISVNETRKFIFIVISTNYFQLLVNLRLAVTEFLMQPVKTSSGRNVAVASSLCKKAEELLQKITDLCFKNGDFDSNDIMDELELYQNLRREISTKLHF